MFMLHAIIQNMQWWQIIIAVVVGSIVGGILFYFFGLGLLLSSIGGIIAACITAAILMGFGGSGQGGGEGNKSGQGIKTEKAEPVKKFKSTGKKVKEGEVVTVNLKTYKFHNKTFTFSEFKDELNSMIPKQTLITIDYRKHYKAIHTKQYEELAREFPEIYFKEINK